MMPEQREQVFPHVEKKIASMIILHKILRLSE
jgi:hypothetical protein